MSKTEYLHIANNKVYSHPEEMKDDNPIIIQFQQSQDPTELGFFYERDFILIQETLDTDNVL
jgi:hypothetical protein